MEVGDLTVFLLHPGEGDSSKVALAEAQQERSWLPVLQQSTLHLLADKPHDVSADTTAQQGVVIYSANAQVQVWVSSFEPSLLINATCWTNLSRAWQNYSTVSLDSDWPVGVDLFSTTTTLTAVNITGLF